MFKAIEEAEEIKQLPDAEKFVEKTVYNLIFIHDPDDKENNLEYKEKFYTVVENEIPKPIKTFEEIKTEIIANMKTDEFVKTRKFNKEKKQYFIVYSGCDYGYDIPSWSCFKVYPIELE